jgi:tetratricopeptide (TPR) repeat protein
MHPARFSSFCSLPFVIILLTVACSKSGSVKTNTLERVTLTIDDSLSFQDACGKVSAYLCQELGICDTSSLGSFNRTLDSAAGSIAKNTGAGTAALDALLGTVYKSWNIGFDSRDTLVETLLPHLVFKSRQGSCVGVSLIILMLAEKLRCPVYGVIVPGHFFCRYDDGARRINIEPNRQGCEHGNDYYKERYPCIHRPGYGLGNLDKKAVIGVLCYNAGDLCLAKKQYDAAIAWYRETLRRIPGFAEAKGNCAVAHARKGNLDTALFLFEDLFAAHPDMMNLALNYGYVAAATKQYSKAVEIYKRGLSDFPDDTVLRKRLEKISGIFK